MSQENYCDKCGRDITDNLKIVYIDDFREK